jgi:hypothetical protein
MQSSAQVEQVVVATLRQLSPEQQQEVLDFTEFWHQNNPSRCRAAVGGREPALI